MKREDIKALDTIAKRYGYTIYGNRYHLYIIPIKGDWHSVEITISFGDDYIPTRFNISFSGYGVLKPEFEELYLNRLNHAKKMCDKLNKKLGEMERESE